MTKLRLFAFLAVTGIFCACASGGKAEPANSGPGDLDAAIRQASKEINDALPQGTKVALLNFTSDSDVFSDYVLEEISIALVQGRKLTVVDRKDIDLIRSEMNFQMSGEVSDTSAQEIGAMLGAQSIVSGSLIHMGENYRFRTKAINVVSAAIQTSSSISVVSDPQIQYLLSQGNRSPAPQPAVAQSGTQAAPVQTIPAQAVTADQVQPAAPEAPAAPALTAYKVGDTGPAGGLIFYDKGNNNGGWRYLEAAPADVNSRPQKAVTEDIDRTDCSERAVGKGKSNTEAIMKIAATKGGGFGWAAQACDAFSLNGFNDWFLASRDELHYLYGHLHMQGLGNFRNEAYWSSTGSGSNNGWSFWREDFSNGQQDYPLYYNTYEHRVRPIRQVAGTN